MQLVLVCRTLTTADGIKGPRNNQQWQRLLASHIHTVLHVSALMLLSLMILTLINYYCTIIDDFKNLDLLSGGIFLSTATDFLFSRALKRQQQQQQDTSADRKSEALARC